MFLWMVQAQLWDSLSKAGADIAVESWVSDLGPVRDSAIYPLPGLHSCIIFYLIFESIWFGLVRLLQWPKVPNQYSGLGR